MKKSHCCKAEIKKTNSREVSELEAEQKVGATYWFVCSNCEKATHVRSMKYKVKEAYWNSFGSEDMECESFVAKLSEFLWELPLAGAVYQPLHRFYLNHLKYKPQEIKHFTQRLWRGYGDDDLWNLDYFMLKKIRKPFKALVRQKEEDGLGYPANLSHGLRNGKIVKKLSDEKAFEEWIKILKTIERAMDLLWREHNRGNILTSEEKKEADKGMKLFGKWFSAFWD